MYRERALGTDGCSVTLGSWTTDFMRQYISTEKYILASKELLWSIRLPQIRTKPCQDEASWCQHTALTKISKSKVLHFATTLIIFCENTVISICFPRRKACQNDSVKCLGTTSRKKWPLLYGPITPLSHLLFRFFISSSFSLSSCSSWLSLGVSSSSSFSSWSSLVFFKASWYLYQTKHLFLNLGCCISMILFNEKSALCFLHAMKHK